MPNDIASDAPQRGALRRADGNFSRMNCRIESVTNFVSSCFINFLDRQVAIATYLLKFSIGA